MLAGFKVPVQEEGGVGPGVCCPGGAMGREIRDVSVPCWFR